MEHNLQLSFGLSFDDLYNRDGLIKLHQLFSDFLCDGDADLHARWLSAIEGVQISAKENSQLIIDVAPFVEDFIGQLFNVSDALLSLKQRYDARSVISYVKRQFIQRYALRKFKDIDAVGQSVLADIAYADDLTFATYIAELLKDEGANRHQLDKVALFCAVMSKKCVAHQVKDEHDLSRSVLFSHPKVLDFNNLVDRSAVHLRGRDGFDLTDPGLTYDYAYEQSNYCIHCHKQEKDSCAKGVKARVPETGVQKNPLGVDLHGCPLDEKISEMNMLKSSGVPVGALATAMIDNPLLAATGHRICNDCTKACIYQKQTPVDIPAIETQTLNDVLDLPWGFEIYSLLSRWNPLNFERPYPCQPSGRKVLIAGMGPAGFNLAHHLLNDGHTVVGVDGLKIEPLPEWQNGMTVHGDKVVFEPIHKWHNLKEPLSTRITGGFGGVAEYGITVRWDKNYLKVIRLLLERRAQFLLKGGVRLGGTLTTTDAFDLGFDHVALCLGAGSPTLLNIKNHTAPGVRQASDFLMALQLTGAHKADSLANLQIQLPVVVVGGGLTAIDTATEAMAYYPVQVRKFKQRYHQLCTHYGKDVVTQQWTDRDHQVADEFLVHAALFESAETRIDEQRMIQDLGGVTLIYRRELHDAPSYRLNHEEIEKALEEGINIQDCAVPKEIIVDAAGRVSGVIVSELGREITLPAKTMLVAAGTKPNKSLTYDEFITVNEWGVFQAINSDGLAVHPEKSPKTKDVHVMIQKRTDGRAISFFGDLHPSFAGNVVKAMASAKRGYPHITQILNSITVKDDASFEELIDDTGSVLTDDMYDGSSGSVSFLRKMNQHLHATVVCVNKLAPTIAEIVIHAPLAARAFKPGQFYRLQNFETLAPLVKGTRLVMEGIALTGASVDMQRGLISLIVLDVGVSSHLCLHLKENEPVVLMGPTGAPTHIPVNETVLLIGGGLGNAVLFSIGKAMRKNGCRVLYVAGYKDVLDVFKQSEIEAAADQIIWCSDKEKPNWNMRESDVAFHGNPIDALIAYHRKILQPCSTESAATDDVINLSAIQRLIVIGSDGLMAAIARARLNELKEVLNPTHTAIGSINSPMQCMMKEICAQCLQRHIDPVTGVETIVYSCVNQDQDLDVVDFNHLKGRLQQNQLLEKLNSQWLRYCLSA